MNEPNEIEVTELEPVEHVELTGTHRVVMFALMECAEIELPSELPQ